MNNSGEQPASSPENLGAELPSVVNFPEAPQGVTPQAEEVGTKSLEAAGVELVPEPQTEVNPYDKLFDPNYEPEPLPGAQAPNGLSEADRAAIRQSVDKNIALTKMYGSQYFNTLSK